MQEELFLEEVEQRAALSRSHLRLEFFKLLFFTIVAWGICAVIVDHAVHHSHWILFDLLFALVAAGGAVLLSVLCAVRGRDL